MRILCLCFCRFSPFWWLIIWLVLAVLAVGPVALLAPVVPAEFAVLTESKLALSFFIELNLLKIYFCLTEINDYGNYLRGDVKKKVVLGLQYHKQLIILAEKLENFLFCFWSIIFPYRGILSQKIPSNKKTLWYVQSKTITLWLLM